MVRAMLAVGCTTLVLGCQGEYPLAPTPCDVWCDATRGFGCGIFYDPAECVAQCEQNFDSREGRCKAQFDAALACFRDTPGAADLRCAIFPSESAVWPCEPELQALYLCSPE